MKCHIATYISGGIHRIGQVQAINDSPLILDLKLIILEESYHFSLHRRTVKIKQKECSIIMKIGKSKCHQHVEKTWNVGIPRENLRWRIRDTWNPKTIWVIRNNEVHSRFLLQLAIKKKLSTFTNL